MRQTRIKTQRPKAPTRGWLTSDEQELEVRRARAVEEAMCVRKLTPARGVLADYLVAKDDPDNPREYRVEIRSLSERLNYCSCPDFAKNQLRTCKHVEKVLLDATRRVGGGGAPVSPFIEVFIASELEEAPRVLIPAAATAEQLGFLRQYLNPMNELNRPWQTTLEVFLRDLRQAPSAVGVGFRVSAEVHQLAAALRHRQRLLLARQQFEADVAAGRRSAQTLRYPLYDYQLEGMKHLAFTGRAMLTDEMGLGKTVQAVAACHLLRELVHVRRVLVVCPVSLKTEWEEQIRKFTDLPLALVYGLRPARLDLYRHTDAFFILANYEQVLRDEREINEVLQPDVVILDEAQRIKNWQTKTAQAIKWLRSDYGFLLTGTPLENRIDEVYSLVEFVNPKIFGSLFRFNREFYELDDRGRAVGFRNLRKLHEALKPIMLRRRKDEIIEQLPERVDNNYFVELTPEQRKRYADYEYPASVLISIARRRPLRPEEMERLQQLLACMRMVCDSAYILDAAITDSPKVDELFRILDDLWGNDPARKVIIFSEWERMLELVRDRCDTMDLAYAWHTGSVPQQKRREEINRFKNDPACRLFVSTDSGGVGLNLQVASAVVNLDLPWNPARLEQRIARAWRKFQKNSVSVINLVAENTLEHRMLATLAAKKGLADGVLDARGDLDSIEMPSGGAVFLQRLGQVMSADLAKPEPAGPDTAEAAAPLAATPQETVPPAELFRQELTVKLGDSLRLCKASCGTDQRVESAFVVVERDSEATREQVQRIWGQTHAGQMPAPVQVLDTRAFALLQQLRDAGLITINDRGMQELFKSDTFGAPSESDAEQRRKAAEPLLQQGERQAKMASVLQAGGFAIEAVAPMRKAVDWAGCALAVMCAAAPNTTAPEQFTPALIPVVCGKGAVSAESEDMLRQFGALAVADESAASQFLTRGGMLLAEARQHFVRLSL